MFNTLFAFGNRLWHGIGWTLGGNQESSILNKAVISHAGADDFTSQPSGNAGNRIACGVIVED